MVEFSIQYSINMIDDEKWLIAKLENKFWTEGGCIPIFGELLETLTTSSFSRICIDLSNLTIVNSHVFGICFNLINVAGEKDKKLKFRFNQDAMETATLTNLHKRVDLELASF